ncbi:hypothetical protein CEXT_805101 [Caerostris extrusa]|uniref:Uncharacterized protein n=1 Tax=Caerostris extrusa TaxID=172846 RepID=A0AAV4PIV2_CAEEX|nr:hypothetical protein CEXT_805101 [Caerostris extrusa]
MNPINPINNYPLAILSIHRCIKNVDISIQINLWDTPFEVSFFLSDSVTLHISLLPTATIKDQDGRRRKFPRRPFRTSHRLLIREEKKRKHLVIFCHSQGRCLRRCCWTQAKENPPGQNFCQL